VKRFIYGGLILCCVVLAACPQSTDTGIEAELEPINATETGDVIPSFNRDGMDQPTGAGGQITEGPLFNEVKTLYNRVRAFKGYDPATGTYRLDLYDPFPHLARKLDTIVPNAGTDQYSGPTRYIMAPSGQVVHIFRTMNTEPGTGGASYYFADNSTAGQNLYTQSRGTMRVNNQSLTGNTPLGAYPWYALVKPSDAPDPPEPPASYSGRLESWKTEAPAGEDIYWSYRASRALLHKTLAEKEAALQRAMGYTDYTRGCWLGPGDTRDRIRERFSYGSPGRGLDGAFGTDVFTVLASKWGGSSTTYTLKSGDPANLDWSKPMKFDGVIPLYVFLTYVKYLHGIDHGNGGAAVTPAWRTVTGYNSLSRESLGYLDAILDLIEGNHHTGEAPDTPYTPYSFRSACHHASYGIRDAPLFLVYDELFLGDETTPGRAHYVDVTL
jgi:hypothetical protein